MNTLIARCLRSLALALLLAVPLGTPAQEPVTTEAPASPAPVIESAATPATASSEAVVASEAATEPTPSPAPEPVHKRKHVRPAVTEATPPADVPSQATPPPEAIEADTTASDGDDVEDVTDESQSPHSSDNEIVSVGHSSTLAAGETASSVVSIFGSSTSHGEVSDAVVSIMGDTTVTGPVGDTVVAVLGDVNLNSHVKGDAVAVFGNMDLGPNAEVDGEVVVVGGTLHRAATAITHGSVQQILGGTFASFKWLRPWFEHCLLYARPLAFAPGLGWAWGVAFGFLALYVLLAIMFRGPMDRCVETFEAQPGKSVLAAFLTQLLTPVVMVLMCVTVIGIALVPFLGIALIVAAIFGKAVMLALIGKRVTNLFGDSPLAHTATAVLIGGVLVLGLYVIPVVGFIAYKLFEVLGLGVVVYTVLIAVKNERELRAATAAAAASSASPPPPSAASAATASVASSSFGPAVDETGTPGAAPGEPIPPPVAQMAIGDAATLPRAGFWIRMAALLIDLILVGIAVHFLNDAHDVLLILLAAYGAVMWKLKGTTIGGIVLGVKVVRLDGRPLDWTTAVVRALSCFLSIAIAGLGFIWIVFDDERQAWHDKIAGTVVVRLPKGVSLV